MNNLTNKCCSINSTIGACDANANIWDMAEVGGECEANHFHGIRGRCVEGGSRWLINKQDQRFKLGEPILVMKTQPCCKIITFGGINN